MAFKITFDQKPTPAKPVVNLNALQHSGSMKPNLLTTGMFSSNKAQAPLHSGANPEPDTDLFDQEQSEVGTTYEVEESACRRCINMCCTPILDTCLVVARRFVECLEFATGKQMDTPKFDNLVRNRYSHLPFQAQPQRVTLQTPKFSI